MYLFPRLLATQISLGKCLNFFNKLLFYTYSCSVTIVGKLIFLTQWTNVYSRVTGIKNMCLRLCHLNYIKHWLYNKYINSSKALTKPQNKKAPIEWLKLLHLWRRRFGGLWRRKKRMITFATTVVDKHVSRVENIFWPILCQLSLCSFQTSVVAIYYYFFITI